MMSANLIAAAAAILPMLVSPAAATSYDLVKEYSGESFFDGWSFYGNCACSASTIGPSPNLATQTTT